MAAISENFLKSCTTFYTTIAHTQCGKIAEILFLKITARQRATQKVGK